MWPRPAEVGEQLGGVAPGVFERVGQDGQAVKVATVVNAGSERDGGFRPPTWVEREHLCRVSEKAFHQLKLMSEFGFVNHFPNRFFVRAGDRLCGDVCRVG